MKAKIMSWDEIKAIYKSTHEKENVGFCRMCAEKIVQAQAEISFKAGYFEGRGLGIRDGMKEVVGWINRISYFNYGQGEAGGCELCFERIKWQAKLKEWGL